MKNIACHNCVQQMKFVIYGEELREPTSADEWVYGGPDRPAYTGDDYVCPSCGMKATNVEGYDPTL